MRISNECCEEERECVCDHRGSVAYRLILKRFLSGYRGRPFAQIDATGTNRRAVQGTLLIAFLAERSCQTWLPAILELASTATSAARLNPVATKPSRPTAPWPMTSAPAAAPVALPR